MHQATDANPLIPARSDFSTGLFRVGEVMTHEAVTLSPDQSFADVVGLMANRPFHHVLVIDSEKRLHGVISDRDVLRAFSRIPDWSKMNVTQVMTENALTTTPDSLISVALRTMLEHHINCLPVLDAHERVCGILTSTDLLSAYETVQTAIEKNLAAINLSAEL